VNTLRILTASEQVAEHLRNELLQGRWAGTMPGNDRLVTELGAGRETIKAALEQLENEGLQVGQGQRRRRRIKLPGELSKVRELRVRILLYESASRGSPFNLDLMGKLQEAGYAANYGRKTLADLGMNVERVAKFVSETPANAWIVEAGSHDVLEWFSSQSMPSFAMFGVKAGLPIAGISPFKGPLAVRRLIELGHRRIVMLVRGERLKPKPALYEQAFLDELKNHGIIAGAYNLPDWGNSPEEFYRCLDSLFQLSPPTALLVSEPKLFNAARDYLSQRGIIAPRDVSLVCDDPDITFSWCKPEIAHFRWDFAPITRRILRWIEHVDQGKEDRRQSYVKAEFYEGGTIGPVPRGK
jgi:DNA-binding LacI/PurR family transcriptional regulator/biotin operon repressor